MQNSNWELVLCSGAEHLEEEFVRAGFSVIKSNRNYDESRKFANSDVYARIPTVKRFQNKKVCLIQSFTCSGENSKHNFTTGDRLIEALQMLDILKNPYHIEYTTPAKRKFHKLNPPGELVLLALHMPFSKQDQIYNTGECNSGKLAVKMLYEAGADRIVTVDPHVPLSFEWFDELIKSGKLKVLSMYQRVIDDIAKRKEYKNIILINTPGKSRTKLGQDTGQINKQRINTNEILIDGDINENLIGKPIFLIDDMVLSGTTMKRARRFFLNKGVKEVYGWITHALPYETGKEENLRRLVDAFDEKIIVSNTIRSQTFNKDFPHCYMSCVPLLIEEFLNQKPE